MTFVEEAELIHDAIVRVTAKAEMDWPPAQPGPIPLDRLIAAFHLVHEEIPALTRSAAASRLAAEKIDLASWLADDTRIAGFVFANAATGLILVEKSDTLARRRFTAAHELGHYLMHFCSSEPEFVQADESEQVCEADQEATIAAMERQANRFAAELLMPEASCRRIAADARSPRFVEHRIAGELLVSRETARWRMRTLKLDAVGANHGV